MRKLFSIITVLFALQTAPAVAENFPLPSVYQPTWLPPESFSTTILDKYTAAQRSAGYEALKNPDIAVETGIAHYRTATDALGSSSDIVPARAAYMEIIRELAYFSVYRGKELATDNMIEGAIAIAKTENEKALAHFLAGWKLAESPLAQQRARAGAEFAQADKIQPAALRDQMLFRYARWAERDGLSTIAGEGAITTDGDYKKALELYSAIAKTTTDNTLSAYADASAKNIRAQYLQTTIPCAFRSGSQVQFTVSSRNCPRIDISLYRVDLGNVIVNASNLSSESLAQTINVPDNAEPVRRVSLMKEPEHPYHNVSNEVRLDSLLMPGAYVVVSTSGDLRKNQILLVTDNVLAIKASRRQILAFTCNAITGKPVQDSVVTIWIRQNKNSDQWYRAAKKADDNGVAFFEASELGNPSDVNECEIMAFSVADQQETMAFLKPSPSGSANESWTSVTIPDSFVYSPGSKVCIHSLVRKRENGQFAVPSKYPVTIQIQGVDTTGFHPSEFETTVDASGEAAISFQIPKNAPAGTYATSIADSKTGEIIGGNSFFSIVPRDVSDVDLDILLSKREDDIGYEVGETIRGNLKTLSREGMPVALGDIVLSVESRTYDFNNEIGGPWKEVSATHLHTDSRGEAPFTIQTAASLQNDFEYKVTATAKDADGRISSVGKNFFVTRQDMYARLSIGKSLYEENQPLELKLETKSSLGTPKEAKGTLRLLKESWQETWIDRRGHEINGDEMQQLRRKGSGWFSFGQSAGDYTLKSQGYATETIAEVELSTDKTGKASYKMAKAQTGYYRFVWVADGRRGAIISNEIPFWVSGPASELSSYRPDRIQIIVNPPSPTGEIGSVALVSVPSPGQNVLLIHGSDTIDSWSVTEIKGTTHLVNVTPDSGDHDSFIEATCVNDEKAGVACARLGAGTPRNLSVSVESNDASYLPGSSADFKIIIRDISGKPVSGAHVFFWLSGSDMTECGQSIADLFREDKSATGLKSSFSTDTTPFFQPSKPSESPAIHNDDESETNPAKEIVPRATSGSVAQDPIEFDELITSDDGMATARVQSMPFMKASWWATALVTSENGSVGFTTKKIATNEALSVDVSFADRIYENDAVEICASLVNNEESDANVGCVIESEGLTPTIPAFETKLAEMAPGKSASKSWIASYRDHGEAQIIFTAKSGSKTLRMKYPLTVRPSPLRKTSTTATILDGDGTVSIAKPPSEDVRAESVCRISASPSRVSLAALPYLLDDPSTGSSEAAARLAVVCDLRRMFEEMRYGEVMIDEAMRSEDIADYFALRMDVDENTIVSNQAKSGAWGWTNPARENDFVTAWNLIMLNHCDDKIRKKLAPSMNAARDYAASAIVSEGHSPDLQAMLLLGVADRDRGKTRPSRLEAKALVNLIRVQDRLGTFALGCLAMSAKKYGFDDEAHKIVSIIKSKAVQERDDNNAPVIKWTASPTTAAPQFSEAENTSMAVMAIVAVDGAKNEYVEPAARFVYEKSVEDRWDGPRETALGVMMIRSIAAYGAETDIAASCEIYLGGVRSGGYNSSTEKPLVPPKRILLDNAAVNNNKLEIRRISGTSPLFVSVETTWKDDPGTAFTKFPDLTISRKFKQTRQVPTLLEGFNEKIVDLDPATTLSCGERIETIVSIESRKPIPMLIVRSPHPGFSKWHEQSAPAEIVNVDVASIDPDNIEQTNTQDAQYISIENLPAGRWEIRTYHNVDYPGEFVIPAASAWIPQRPSIRAESNSVRLKCAR